MSVLRNAFTDRWHDSGSGPRAGADGVDPVIAQYRPAVAERDYTIANVTAGQAAGLIHSTAPAGDIVTVIADQAVTLLGR